MRLHKQIAFNQKLLKVAILANKNLVFNDSYDEK